MPERVVGQFDDVPVPQILNEVEAVKNHPQERVSGKIDDTVPVDQPVDQVRCDPQAAGVPTTVSSVSDCGEGGGSPAGAVHRQNYGRASDHALLQRYFPQIQIVVKTTKSCPCHSSADMWTCF